MNEEADQVIRIPIEGSAEPLPPIDGCQHNKSHAAECKVGFLTDVNRYVMEVRVHCLDCGTRFRFEGLPTAVFLTKPCRDMLGYTATIPITPGEHRELSTELQIHSGVEQEDPDPEADRDWEQAFRRAIAERNKALADLGIMARERDKALAEREAWKVAASMIPELTAERDGYLKAMDEEIGRVAIRDRQLDKLEGEVVHLKDRLAMAQRWAVGAGEKHAEFCVGTVAQGQAGRDDAFNRLCEVGGFLEALSRTNFSGTTEEQRICAGCDGPIFPGQSMVGSDVFSVYAHKHCEAKAMSKAFPPRPETDA